MKKGRSAYLVTKSLKQYLSASIITMAVFNLNTMADGILMGNFLGPDALSAINLCLPVTNSIAALGILLTAGAVLISANALGQMDRGKMHEAFTLSSVAQWVSGLLLLCVSAPLGSALAGLVSGGGELAPLCEKYIRVLLTGSVVLMYANAFGSFVQVNGYPKAVTVIMSLSVIVNILLDVLLVGVLGVDISGSAWASVAGNLVSVLCLIVFALRKKGMLKLSFRIQKPLAKMGEIIAKSVPQMLGVVSIMVLQVICNSFIRTAQGKEGVFVLSVGYSLLGISSMVSSGMSSAFTAIGGTMMGQKDHQGLRYLYRRGMMICLLTGIGFLLLSLLIPRSIAGLFGADTEELLVLAARGVPMICTFILMITVVLPCSIHYQVIGRFTLSSVSNLSIVASALVSFLLVSVMLPAENIWLAFPLSCVLCLLTVAAGAALVRRSAGNRVTFPDLVPDAETEVRKLDLSVACTEEGCRKGIREIRSWLSDSGYGALSMKIAHCMEELLLNCIRHSGGNADHDIDVLIRGDGREVTALLKDDGIPFNTSGCLAGNKTYGLMLVRHYCGNIEYNYSFGQNMTMLKWSLAEPETK